MWLDRKYTLLISSQLELFHQVGENWNFRCPICGDSKKSKRKTRAWILFSGNEARFYCHNCSASMKFRNFLKQTNDLLYYEYVKDRMLEFGHKEAPKDEDFSSKPDFSLKTLSNCINLGENQNHPVVNILKSRLIPIEKWNKIYYVDIFKAWVNEMIPNKFESIKNDEGRIIFPLIDRDGTIFGFQGRSLLKDSPTKYITILLNEDKPKLFGLDSINEKDTIYVLEGPIDSLFIINSLASCGGRLETNLELASINKDKCVLIYDNEPRKTETIQKMNKAIKSGYSICIWPNDIEEKDINDMIINNFTVDHVQSVINTNIYHGLGANLRMTSWKKV